MIKLAKLKLGRRLIAFIVVCIMTFIAVGCNSDNNNSNTEEVSPPVVDGVEINDALVKLQINDLMTIDGEVLNIDVQEIKNNAAQVAEITSIELEIVSINDEFVYVAYQHFVDYYGEDFDLGKFLINMGVGVTVIAVCVGLSFVSGPVGTFFGAVIASEFTAPALIIGTAIDMAIEGAMAYAEGGDASYIIGHMLNGAAEGFMIGALLAPLTGLASGVKAVKAAKSAKQISQFAKYSTKQVSTMMKNTPDILKYGSKLADNASDALIKQAYQEFASKASKEITEDMFMSIIKNKKIWVDNILNFNPFNVASDVAKQLKKSFFDKANISDDITNKILKEIKNGTISKVDDFSKYAIKDYVDANFKEFLELFGGNLSKEFIDASIKSTIGETAENAFKNAVGKNKNLYCELLKTLNKVDLDDILTNYDALMLLQLRYGSSHVNSLLHLKSLYNAMLKNNNITSTDIAKVIDGILDGSIKNLSDVSKINSQIAKNLQTSSEMVADSLKNLKLGTKSKSLLNELVQSRIKNHVKSNILPDGVIIDIVTNGLKKAEIVSKYGDAAYKELVDKIDYVLPALKCQNSVNHSLINSMFADYLTTKSIDSNTAQKIIRGIGIDSLGLEKTKLKEIANVVAEYYKATNTKIYSNFVKAFAEIRCEDALAFNKSINYTPLNGEYAGMLKPSTNPYIQAKYGDIYYNSAGYPIFDEHAVARIELLDLTGLNGGMDDIKRANLIHHGTQENIPGYTWHHIEDGKTLILIPTELHNAAVSGYGHSGGAKLLRDGFVVR